MSSSPGFNGAMEVWIWAPVIDKAVKEFADEADLDCALRPQDEYIWYVRTRPESDAGFFQQVQVAVFDRCGDDGPAVFFTPFAYMVTGGSTRATPPGAAKPGSLPL